MTTSIAKFMRDLEQAWDAHQQALLQRRDLARGPRLAGRRTRRNAHPGHDRRDRTPGRRALSTPTRSSRTCPTDLDAAQDLPHGGPVAAGGRDDGVVHPRPELPWLLPGAEPTFRRAEVLAIAVVGFERTRIRSQRVLWDHATLAAQPRLNQLLPQQPPARRDELCAAAVSPHEPGA